MPRRHGEPRLRDRRGLPAPPPTSRTATPPAGRRSRPRPPRSPPPGGSNPWPGAIGLAPGSSCRRPPTTMGGAAGDAAADPRLPESPGKAAALLKKAGALFEPPLDTSRFPSRARCCRTSPEGGARGRTGEDPDHDRRRRDLRRGPLLLHRPPASAGATIS